MPNLPRNLARKNKRSAAAMDRYLEKLEQDVDKATENNNLQEMARLIGRTYTNSNARSAVPGPYASEYLKNRKKKSKNGRGRNQQDNGTQSQPQRPPCTCEACSKGNIEYDPEFPSMENGCIFEDKNHQEQQDCRGASGSGGQVQEVLGVEAVTNISDYYATIITAFYQNLVIPKEESELE